MNPGVYIVRPGVPDPGRRFDSLAKAQQVMVAHDMVVMIGDKGKELGKWVRNEAGTLTAIVAPPRKQDVPLSPAVQEILDRKYGGRGRYVPPLGGYRTANGNSFAVGQTGQGQDIPDASPPPGVPGEAGRIPSRKETP